MSDKNMYKLEQDLLTKLIHNRRANKSPYHFKDKFCHNQEEHHKEVCFLKIKAGDRAKNPPFPLP